MERNPTKDSARSQRRYSTQRNRSISDCPECYGDGWVRVKNEQGISVARRCNCKSSTVVAARLDDIPERFKESTFENYYPKNKKQEKAKAYMQKNSQKSVFLLGGYGVGKTHLAISQYKKLISDGYLNLIFRTNSDLVDELIQWEIHKIVSPVMYAVDNYKKFHFFWDDPGITRATNFRWELYFSLIDTMYRRNLNLTITSNLCFEDLAAFPDGSERLGYAATKRLVDMCELIDLVEEEDDQ